MRNFLRIVLKRKFKLKLLRTTGKHSTKNRNKTIGKNYSSLRTKFSLKLNSYKNLQKNSSSDSLFGSYRRNILHTRETYSNL